MQPFGIDPHVSILIKSGTFRNRAYRSLEHSFSHCSNGASCASNDRSLQGRGHGNHGDHRDQRAYAAPNRVDLVARVTAFIDERHFAEGAEVKKEDLLFSLERARCSTVIPPATMPS